MNKRDLPFQLYFQYDSKELFAYELNGDYVHEVIVLEVGAQLWNFAEADGDRLIVGHGMNNYGGRMMNADQCLGLMPTALPAPPPAL